MIQDQEKIQEARGLVEQAAEQFVMIDVSNHDELHVLSESLTTISQSTAKILPRCSEAASLMARHIESSLTKGTENSQFNLQQIEEAISLLQSVLQGQRDENQIDFPFVSDMQHANNAPRNGDNLDSQARQMHFSAVVDQEIIETYIDQQEERLAEMEDLILSYEHDKEMETLTQLRRHLHTAKGEAGAVGVNEIEQVCHLVEDYIQDSSNTLQADVLLAFKDWFAQTIQAIRSQENIPFLPQEIFNELQSQPNEGTKEHSLLQSETEEQTPPDESLPEICQPVPIEDPEITGDFISEAQEHFDVVEENLMILENEPGHEEAISAVFRAFHTIKGTTSFLGLASVSELAHKAETLLDEVRKGRLAFQGKVVEATFNAQDMLKKMIDDLSVALSQGQYFTPDRGMLDVLNSIYDALDSQEDDLPESSSPEPVSAPEHAPTDIQEVQESPQVDSNPPLEKSEPEPSTSSPAFAQDRSEPVPQSEPQVQSKREIKQTMKIDAEKIDLLLDTIGELVIVESIVRQDPELATVQSNRLERNLAQLTKITRGLQDMGMSMRMVPIDSTFRKMARLVRDLAKKSCKEVELSMLGKETELDKAMVEKLGDPLVHMIRNAVDHGIESSPEERIAAGKMRSGHITLKAYHEGGSIHIEIKDDGRGLNRQAILEKALERGVVQSPDGMSDEEIYALIFEPGFSTAQKVTDVSGRGVGMDVVKSNVESMRGNIRIHSVPGQGSTFTLILPLTMAIIDGMIVKLGKERYIIPLLSIIESFQPTRDMINTVTGRGETVPFRGRLLPLFRLYELFGVQDSESDPTKAIVVVVEDAGRQVALLVDKLLGQNQTVIKSLGEAMGSIEGVAGASIMPDGSPGLIIDVNGVVKLATSR